MSALESVIESARETGREISSEEASVADLDETRSMIMSRRNSIAEKILNSVGRKISVDPNQQVKMSFDCPNADGVKHAPSTIEALAAIGLHNRKTSVQTSMNTTLAGINHAFKSGHQCPEAAIFELFTTDDDPPTASLSKVIRFMKAFGIQESDPRLKKVVSFMKSRDDGTHDETTKFRVDLDTFTELIHPMLTTFAQAFRNSFIIPNWSDFIGVIREMFEDVRNVTGGEVATYIPQLARQDPEIWGVAICTIDGQRVAFGDSRKPFCLQSVSKAFNYAIVSSDLGAEQVHKWVGYEPSGRLFNEICLDANGKPHNPMINAGAIIVTSLIKNTEPMADRFDYMMQQYKKLSGGEHVGFDNATFLSERETADRNYALSYYMKENKCFPQNEKVDGGEREKQQWKLREELDLYFQLCSLETNCETAAVMAATLANGGICPLTNERCIDPLTCRNVLSLMYSCGMYDYSGKFAFSVGLPAKSGVSGGMVVVVPNLMGICLFSPRLDKMGNSTRGVAFCKKLVEYFNFHNYDSILHSTSAKQDPRRNVLAHKQEPIVSLNFAAQYGEIDAIRIMYNEGVRMDQRDYDGRTALHVAASAGHMQICRFLVEDCKVPVTVKDRWDRTAIDDARHFKNHEIQEYLMQVYAEQVLTRHGQENRRVGENDSGTATPSTEEADTTSASEDGEDAAKNQVTVVVSEAEEDAKTVVASEDGIENLNEESPKNEQCPNDYYEGLLKLYKKKAQTELGWYDVMDLSNIQATDATKIGICGLGHRVEMRNNSQIKSLTLNMTKLWQKNEKGEGLPYNDCYVVGNDYIVEDLELFKDCQTLLGTITLNENTTGTITNRINIYGTWTIKNTKFERIDFLEFVDRKVKHSGIRKTEHEEAMPRPQLLLENNEHLCLSYQLDLAFLKIVRAGGSATFTLENTIHNPVCDTTCPANDAEKYRCFTVNGNLTVECKIGNILTDEGLADIDMGKIMISQFFRYNGILPPEDSKFQERYGKKYLEGIGYNKVTLNGNLIFDSCDASKINDYFETGRIENLRNITVILKNPDVDSLVKLDVPNDPKAIIIDTDQEISYVKAGDVEKISAAIKFTKKQTIPKDVCVLPVVPDHVSGCTVIDGDLEIRRNVKTIEPVLQEIKGCLIMKNTTLDNYDFLLNLKSIGTKCLWTDKGTTRDGKVKPNTCIPPKIINDMPAALKDKSGSGYDATHHWNWFECGPKYCVYSNVTERIPDCTTINGDLIITSETQSVDAAITKVTGCIYIVNSHLPHYDFLRTIKDYSTECIFPMIHGLNSTVIDNNMCIDYRARNFMEHPTLKEMVKQGNNTGKCPECQGGQIASLAEGCQVVLGDLVVDKVAETDKEKIQKKIFALREIYGRLIIKENSVGRLNFRMLTTIHSTGKEAALDVSGNPGLTSLELPLLAEIYTVNNVTKYRIEKNPKWKPSGVLMEKLRVLASEEKPKKQKIREVTKEPDEPEVEETTIEEDGLGVGAIAGIAVAIVAVVVVAVVGSVVAVVLVRRKKSSKGKNEAEKGKSPARTPKESKGADPMHEKKTKEARKTISKEAMSQGKSKKNVSQMPSKTTTKSAFTNSKEPVTATKSMGALTKAKSKETLQQSKSKEDVASGDKKKTKGKTPA